MLGTLKELGIAVVGSGRIGTLRYGMRLATPEDVTHVRWRVPADHAAAGRGQIAYSGIVR